MARIALVATGGTIASSRSGGDDRVRANKSGADLKDALHDPLPDIDLDVHEFATVGSFAMTLPLAFDLAGKIGDCLDAADCDGVVVTHGTDTMEESCYLAHLLRRSEKPVVFTGAQRHAGDPDSDGPRNLADAIRAAASPAARGLGAMIVFEQEIHGARAVSKVHTSRVDTFRSPGLGKLGEIDQGDVHIQRRPELDAAWAPERIEPAVDLFKLAMGAAPWVCDAAIERGAKGLVLEGFGRGNAPPGFADAIRRATAAGVPVVVASRCPEGHTRAVYGGEDGGRELVDAGAILAGSLSGLKSRLQLAVCLGAGQSRDEIAASWPD